MREGRGEWSDAPLIMRRVMPQRRPFRVLIMPVLLRTSTCFGNSLNISIDLKIETSVLPLKASMAA